MPDVFQTMTIPAATAELARVRRAVQAWCSQAGLSAPQARALLHAVDETVANAIEHGIGESNGRPISISPVQFGKALSVKVAYKGDAFNPVAAGPTDPRAPLRKRRVHGYGLALCRRLVDDIRYRYRDGVNEVELVVREVRGQ